MAQCPDENNDLNTDVEEIINRIQMKINVKESTGKYVKCESVWIKINVREMWIKK